jgi:hypothetical protein
MKYFFSFFKWGTLAQKKGTFFTLKKVGAHALIPPLPHRFRGPWISYYALHNSRPANSMFLTIKIFLNFKNIDFTDLELCLNY